MRDNQDLIDKYVRGELDEEGRKLFKESLKNPNFAKEVKEYMSMNSALAALDGVHMKSILQNVEANIGNDNLDKERKHRSKKHLIWYLIVALILGAAIAFIGVKVFGSNSQQKLYADFYQSFPNIIDPIQKGENKENPTAFQLYEMQKYNEVIDLFLSSSFMSSSERFYLGCSYMETKQYDKAKAIFQKLLDDKKYSKHSQWYLAMVCLATSKDCLDLLDVQILKRDNYYGPRVNEILEILKE